MSNYELVVNFSKEALEAIYAAGEKLIVTKEVSGSKGSSVCWVSTLPFMNNSIKWTEEYMLYASREEAMNGATIEKLSDEDGITELLYDFKEGIFDNARTDSSVGKNEYGVCNRMDQYSVLTFGLAQKVDVNGTKEEGRPINAVTLPFNHTASFSPIERVRVFLAANVNNGMVITKEFSNTIDVTYTGAEVSKSIAYDDSKGMFIPVN